MTWTAAQPEVFFPLLLLALLWISVLRGVISGRRQEDKSSNRERETSLRGGGSKPPDVAGLHALQRDPETRFRSDGSSIADAIENSVFSSEEKQVLLGAWLALDQQSRRQIRAEHGGYGGHGHLVSLGTKPPEKGSRGRLLIPNERSLATKIKSTALRNPVSKRLAAAQVWGYLAAVSMLALGLAAMGISESYLDSAGLLLLGLAVAIWFLCLLAGRGEDLWARRHVAEARLLWEQEERPQLASALHQALLEVSRDQSRRQAQRQREVEQRRKVDYWRGLRGGDGTRFERAVAAAFEEVGYSARTTTASGDEGVDIWLDGNIPVQCKAYSGRVGRPDLQRFFGATAKSTRRIFVSTGGFTKQAAAYAREHGIEIWGPKRLVELAEGSRR